MQQRKDELVAAFGDRESFLKAWNPDAAIKLVDNPQLCHFGGAPTLGELNQIYGSRTGAMWLVPQLYSLSEYGGVRDKLEGSALMECASIIDKEYHYLNVAEFMLFFYRFKTGRYGRFYGSIDPLIITCALRDFIDERTIEIERHDQEVRILKEEEERRLHPPISYQDWLLIKPIAAMYNSDITIDYSPT